MRKVIVAFLVLGICLLGMTQLALATEAAVSPEKASRPCFLDLLSNESREQVESIIREYYEKMMALRERMQSSRVAGDRDDLQELREEMWDLKQEKRDALAPYIPEDFREQFANREFERRQVYRPDCRSFKHGWNKSWGNCF